MNNSFLKIGITRPGPESPSGQQILKEAEEIVDILKSGRIDLLHIRKPGWNKADTEALIKAIPEKYHKRLKLHDHFGLLSKYDLGGVHLNSRNPTAPSNAANVSRSIHSLQELANTCGTCYDYMTLSPIYDSISKPGYKSIVNGSPAILQPLLKEKNVIALGGVTEEKFEELEKAGFSGAAMLGNLWKNDEHN